MGKHKQRPTPTRRSGRLSLAKKIGQVLAVVKKHHADWDVPAAGVPVANLRLNFYQGDKLLGNVGLGRTFLTALFRGNFLPRSFDTAVYTEILELVGLEFKRLGNSSVAEEPL